MATSFGAGLYEKEIMEALSALPPGSAGKPCVVLVDNKQSSLSTASPAASSVHFSIYETYVF